VFNNRTILPGLNRSAVFSLIVVGIAGTSGSDAMASCGDYLYKRGPSPGHMAPMEHHDSGSRCEQEDGSLPLIPPPIRERSDSDELASLFLVEMSGDDDRQRRRHANLCVLPPGFRDRIDRPPQADLNDELI